MIGRWGAPLFCWLSCSILSTVHYNPDRAACRWRSPALLALALASLFSLAIAGAVNASEDAHIHTAAATTFGAGFLLYMLLSLSTFLSWDSNPLGGRISAIARALTVAACVAATAAKLPCIQTSMHAMLPFFFNQRPDWAVSNLWQYLDICATLAFVLAVSLLAGQSSTVPSRLAITMDAPPS